MSNEEKKELLERALRFINNFDKNGSSLGAASWCYYIILKQLPGDIDVIEGLRKLAPMCMYIDNDDGYLRRYISRWSLETIIEQYPNCEENLEKFNNLYESCRLTEDFDKVISFVDNIIESNNKKEEYCICNRCSECGKIIKEKLN